jgi:hypothetical protein
LLLVSYPKSSGFTSTADIPNINDDNEDNDDNDNDADVPKVKTSKKKSLFGCMKGLFVLPLPDDFNGPLEEFEEYM